MKKNFFWMSNKEYAMVTQKTPIPAVNLVIIRKGQRGLEVLLVIRKTGYAKGQWCTIGGRVWIGESLKDAIGRQAKDLGVKVKIILPFTPNFPSFIDDRKDQDRTKQPLSFIYPAEIISGKVREEGEEYRGYKWFSANKLPEIGYKQKLQIQKTIARLRKNDII